MSAGRTWRATLSWIVVALLAAPASAQDAETPPVDAVEPSEPTPLPAPTLPSEQPEEAAPEEPAEVPILPRIRGTPTTEDPLEEEEPLAADIPFVVPGDARGAGGISVRVDEPPLPFMVAAGARFARYLVGPQDFLRLEQRFTARVPEFPALKLGASVAEYLGDRFLFEAGGRLGLSTYLCDLDGRARCEAEASVLLGVLTGDLGTYFDLGASLDLRLNIERFFEVAASGGFSFINGTTILHGGGELGLCF